jgi:hypothetical protein
MDMDIDPVLIALGKLIVNYNGAEETFRHIAYLLIDPNDQRAGQLTVGHLGTTGLLDLVPALAGHRLHNRRIVKDVIAAVERFADAREQRDDFIESIWHVPNDFTGPEDVRGVRRDLIEGIDTELASLDPQPIKDAVNAVLQVMRELEDLYASIMKEFSAVESIVHKKR